MVSRKNISRKSVLLLSVTLGLFGLNLSGWRAVADSPASPMLATAYFTDFTGKSGSMPAGWTDIGFDSSPQSTVVERGTVVAITDVRQPMTNGGGPQLIQSNFTFATPSDPAATMTLTADIASAPTNTPTALTQVVVGLGNIGGYAIVAQFNNGITQTSQFNVILVQGGIPVGVFPLPSTASNPGYVGGQFDLTLTLDTNSLRLTSGAYDSGDVPYTSAGIAGFDSLDDLGASVGIILGAGAEGHSPNDIISTVNFDSVLLDVSATGLSPKQQIEALISRVDSLLKATSLSPSQANILKSKLNRAITQLNQGQAGDPCNPLNGFITQVGDYITAGSLNSTIGQLLINDATAIKTSLGC